MAFGARGAGGTFNKFTKNASNIERQIVRNDLFLELVISQGLSEVFPQDPGAAMGKQRSTLSAPLFAARLLHWLACASSALDFRKELAVSSVVVLTCIL